MTTLHLADELAGADLATFVGRAHRLDSDGAARLQASGERLAVWVGVLPGAGLTHDGVVLGLRVLALADGPDQPVDTTVSLASLQDRFARWGEGRRSSELSVPPTQVRAAWAGLLPPASGWAPVGELDASDVAVVARDGIAEIAAGAGTQSPAQAVAQLRAAVWGRPMIEAGLPAGLAFAACGLGFVTGAADEPAVRVHRAGRWWRLTTQAGHVLGR